jgi:hypothetical protein
MSDDKTKNFRFITPVESLPGKKRDSKSLYDDIINEFSESKLKYAEVTLTGKAPLTIASSLRRCLKQKGISEIKVRYIGKKIYLESTIDR